MELTRRWVAALMLVPQSEREGVVAGIERRLVEIYGDGEHAWGARGNRQAEVAASANERSPARPASVEKSEMIREAKIVLPAQQRQGYVEQVHKHLEIRTPARTTSTQKASPLKAKRKTSA